MTAADALAKELTELQSFLHDQRKYSSGPRFEEMLQQHALVMVGKIRVTQLSPQNGQQFMAIVNNGPWSQQQVQGLAEAVNESVLGTSPKRIQLQNVISFRGYFSKKDLETLKSEAALAIKIECTLPLHHFFLVNDWCTAVLLGNSGLVTGVCFTLYFIHQYTYL